MSLERVSAAGESLRFFWLASGASLSLFHNSPISKQRVSYRTRSGCARNIVIPDEIQRFIEIAEIRGGRTPASRSLPV